VHAFEMEDTLVLAELHFDATEKGFRNYFKVREPQVYACEKR
jgi:hypothetical protein